MLINHYGRSIRRFFSRSFKGLHIGRSVLYTIYWAVNLILALTDVDLTNLNYVSLTLWRDISTRPNSIPSLSDNYGFLDC